MNDPVIRTKWSPRWLTALIVAAWMAAIAAVAYQIGSGAAFESRELLAALPLLLLLAYGSLAFVLNKTEVSVSSDRIEVRNGPVPTGAMRQSVDLSKVEACYYRHSVVPLKAGTASAYATGVRLRDGAWCDINPNLHSIDDARTAAERIAAKVREQTGRNLQAGEQHGFPAPPDWRQRRGLLAWSGAFIAALVWMLLVGGV